MKKKEIILDKSKRYIYCEGKPLDFTIIQILKKDCINDERYLKPDLNYNKENEFYKNKDCYLAGYPSDLNGERKQEGSISTGKIIKYNDNYDFYHDIATVNCSSGSPICLKDNLLLVGIHKETYTKEKVNCGTFVQKIINDIQNENTYKEINSIKKIDNEYSSSDEEESIDLSEPSLNKPLKKEKKLLRYILCLTDSKVLPL